MNARRTFVLSLAIVLTAAATAQAGPGIGTPKARGEFGGYGWVSPGSTRSAYRAPTAYRAPVVVESAPAIVAEAPAEGRRFSYAPSDQAVTSNPCPPVQTPSTAPMVESGRRYSYAPTPEATVTQSAPSPRAYYSTPSYSTGGRSGPGVDRWALPKTDPRKYSTR